MDDLDCIMIENRAIAHLINCAFDDFHLNTLELVTEINTNLTRVMGEL